MKADSLNGSTTREKTGEIARDSTRKTLPAQSQPQITLFARDICHDIAISVDDLEAVSPAFGQN